MVNTVEQARVLYQLLAFTPDTVLRHLSTRMCPAHRRAVLAEVNNRLAVGAPVILVSTQLIEAGVDLDFPTVFRALAPVESLRQAAGLANREGKLAGLGRVVVFDAADTTMPVSYRTAVSATRAYFGPDRATPDDVTALREYYRDLHQAVDIGGGERGRAIQEYRRALDFRSVADGPLMGDAAIGRDRSMAFRMLDDDPVSIVVTNYAHEVKQSRSLLEDLRATRHPTRESFRALQPYTVSLPRRILTDPVVATMCRPILDDQPGMLEWGGDYDAQLGINEHAISTEYIW